MKDRIISYIAQGLTAVKIASILGCTESYISQIQGEEGFEEALEEEKKKHLKSAEEETRDKGYDSLEDRVRNQIEENISYASFTELTSLMNTLIKRKQQTAPTGMGTLINNTTQNNYVVLQIPHAAAPEIVLSREREVVAIGEQNLTPMPSASVKKLFGQILEKRVMERKEKEAKGQIYDVPQDL